MAVFGSKSPLPTVGSAAPALDASDQHGVMHRLGDYADRPIVLWFYPKDDTPG